MICVGAFCLFTSCFDNKAKIYTVAEISKFYLGEQDVRSVVYHDFDWSSKWFFKKRVVKTQFYYKITFKEIPDKVFVVELVPWNGATTDVSYLRAGDSVKARLSFGEDKNVIKEIMVRYNGCYEVKNIMAQKKQVSSHHYKIYYYLKFYGIEDKIFYVSSELYGLGQNPRKYFSSDIKDVLGVSKGDVVYISTDDLVRNRIKVIRKF